MRTNQPDIPKTPHLKWGNCGGASGTALDPGSGDWSSSRSSLGVYVVTFNKPFATIPIILAVPHYGGGGVMVDIQARSANNFTMATFLYTGGAIDSNVMWAAFGVIKPS